MGIERFQQPEVNSVESIRDVIRDVRFMLWSTRLHSITRYYHQRHWERETLEEEFANKLRSGIRLESVSEHSWHVADIIVLLGPRFEVDHYRALELAILHDKLELITGDKSPIGRDGTGQKSHAFNVEARVKKDKAERDALERYLSRLPMNAQASQRLAFEELACGATRESRLVKAVDKFQSLIFVHLRKSGELSDTHLQFTIKYARKSVELFPQIEAHYLVLLRIVLGGIARARNVSVNEVIRVAQADQHQLDLFRTTK